MTVESVAVVGGGIGGLSAAVSLLRAGFDVQVFEQASALGEVGGGVQISPNASQCCTWSVWPMRWPRPV
jgi:2-polyprenyl-6-methoxyphenol hydroxylase-like FAD-dependent oxidoreductase